MDLSIDPSADVALEDKLDDPNPLRPPDEAVGFFFFVLDLAIYNAVDANGDDCNEHDVDGETKASLVGHSVTKSKKTTTAMLLLLPTT